MEDLWPFNEERLARAVAASRIPVISAVGHEIDFTICDFAADLRVPTPSAAAELVIGRREEFLTRLQRFEKDLKQALRWCWQQAQQRLKRAEQSYVFREPVHLVQIKMQQVDERYERLQRVLGRRLEMNLRRLTAAENRLEAMDPQAVLKRGYALLEHGDGASGGNGAGAIGRFCFGYDGGAHHNDINFLLKARKKAKKVKILITITKNGLSLSSGLTILVDRRTQLRSKLREG